MRLNPDETFELIKSRRSTRKFKPISVPKDMIMQVVEAGRYAPSGGNSQSTHFIVITAQDVLNQLMEQVQNAFASMEFKEGMYASIAHSIEASKRGNYVFHYHAPVLILTANRFDYGNNIADCACALQNMMLMANALDFGSCWINQLKWLNENPEILSYLKTLGLAENERVYGALALGYPDTEDGMPVRQPLPRSGNPVSHVE